ncbi:MAG: molybdenum cofactor biosynthesis protein B [Halanaeroarchaeum sp.]
MVDFQERDTKIVDTDETDGDDEAKTGENVEQTRERADEYHEDEGNAHDESHADHHAHDEARVGAAIVTVSSTRSLDDDPSGDAIATAFEDDGHEVVTRELVRDSLDAIQSTVDALTDRADVDVVVTTGGTGVSPDDVTVEAVRPLLEKNLPGFGELFRTLSYDEIGTGIIGTRALGGVSDAVPVFVLPGSESAVSLATEEIILPEIGHLAGLATRGLDEDEE